MAIPKTSNGGIPQQAPATEAKQAPKSESKTPPQNTAAKQAPKETKVAVNNTFGNVPSNDATKQPAGVPKSNLVTGIPSANVPPANHEKEPAGTDAKSAAPDAKAAAPDAKAAGPDAKAPGPDAKAPGPDAKAPGPDAKAAGPDAKAPGPAAKAPGPDAKAAAPDAKPMPAFDPKAAPGQPGSKAMDANGQPIKTPDGRDIVLDKNGNLIPVEADGMPTADAKGNPYAVDKTGNYRATADGKTVVYATELDGKAVGLNDNGKYVDDFHGNPKAVNPDGNYAKTVDGLPMVYNMDAGGKIAAKDRFYNDMLTGPQDVVYVINPDGQYAVTDDGKYLAYGNSPDGKYFAVANGDKLLGDNEGNPYTLTEGGQYMQPEPGKFAVLNPYGKLVASDANTGWLFRDAKSNAYALDPNGKYMQPEPGKFAVFNEQTGKTIATDGNGNPVADANGNPYLVGEDGQYAKSPDGKYDVYTPKATLNDFDPVKDASDAVVKTPDGLALYKDKSTGEAVGVTSGGIVVKVDPQTNLMVKDPATQLPMMVNDPFAERPQSWQNLTPAETLEKMPVGAERGDPMKVKDELFKNGILDKESLYTALGKYDVLDVYDALLNSSKYGGWNNAPKVPLTGQLIRPNENQARALIAAMISWQNQNAPYTPITQGKVPFLGLFEGDFEGAAFSYHGDVFVSVMGKGRTDMIGMAENAFHEMNHVYGANSFRNTLKDAGEESDPQGVNNEVVTEYIANLWTKSGLNSNYDKLPGMKGMNDAVKELGGGDINVGNDLLRKAYFKGDPVATQMFIAAVKKTRGLEYVPPVPIDQDPTRPAVRPNEDPRTTLKNLPQSAERGDPMKIKDELFDQYSNLDADKLIAAAAKYDPRDIYDALINSGKYGGWDQMELVLKDDEKVVHPNEEQSRQVIAAMIAWQNENGKYNPLRQGKVPSIIFYNNGKEGVGGRSANNIYINADYSKGVDIATGVFHEMNHDASSDEFKQAYLVETPEGRSSSEVVTEYLANNWSGDKTDTSYERDLYRKGFEKLDEVVMTMGNGDRNKGLDLLKRAYFAGEQAAMDQLLTLFPPTDYSK